MTSLARATFKAGASDVKYLLELHEQEGGPDPGRRARQLEVLNKSAIVLTCAVWEAYVEDIAAEAIDHYVQHASPANLPASLREAVGKELQGDSDKNAPWRLADTGWQSELKNRLKRYEAERNRGLNTPKAKQVDGFFETVIGIPQVSDHWRWQNMTPQQARNRLDEFVSLRGDIAHRSQAGSTVKKSQVKSFRFHVEKLVQFTDSYVNDQLEQITGVPLF